MVRLLGILVLVLDVVVVLDIYRGNMDTERKVLWILIVFFLPLLGPLLYYVVAKSR
ncbi:MAG TPA: PLDc N-terminal domain-containing protein [Cyclobacteriaceae bacterium]|nr:PLDc N-terminal domain-containing protein [Cyclobacteriaceae bacterium]MCB9238424.1 PLDc N-terminal domain-containing protein [Flammeovirgaceae bacterium]MCB0500944.1 PLDc N-terminal domain-containing protein [Cyclobacteriaceae bacterium]MCO5271281.1 PLDc N-terminal domain-containing protein [Cyclobacteriaceae bacterium]MCW5903911.1 PLDc N-terminal domain-containing protein [Cyclobacteriaceae bacterium]